MPAHSPRAVHTVAHPPAPVDSFGAYPQTPCTDADHSERKMIGILLPLTALGLMLQPRLNTRSTTPLSAPGTGTRAVVPLRMADGFVESVEDLETKIKEAAGKIKEAEGLAEDKVGDLEYKTKAEIAELSRLDENQISEAVEKILKGLPEDEDAGDLATTLPGRQLQILKLLKFFNVPVIAGEIIQVISKLLQKGREGVEVPVGDTTFVVTTDFLSSLWQFGAARRPNHQASTLFLAPALTLTPTPQPDSQTLSSICCSRRWSQGASSFGGGRRPGTTSRAPTATSRRTSRRATSGRTSSSQTCVRRFAARTGDALTRCLDR